jgi:predicted RNA-binding Zn-ribbon protein involved in translation (DUF1610 family)
VQGHRHHATTTHDGESLMNAFKGIKYTCPNGHVMILRVTSARPDPDRWQGEACAYCLHNGIDATFHRVETAYIDPNEHPLRDTDYSRDHVS